MYQFEQTGSVMDNKKSDAGRKKSVGPPEIEAYAQEVITHSPSKFTKWLSLKHISTLTIVQ